MSGHSHWATTKRQKAVKDIARGKVFSKITRAISLAARSGTSPESNPKLRMAIGEARGVNMPKENIERAIARGSHQDVQLEEINYEGFGPGGINIIIETATDNKNRTSSEIKSILEKGGGSMGGPGSVAFNFSPKGHIVLSKSQNVEEQTLSLIDLGVEDIEEGDGVLDVYVSPSEVVNAKDRIEKLGYKVETIELVKRPKNYMLIMDRDLAKRVVSLLSELEDHDDVQNVFANVDIASDSH